MRGLLTRFWTNKKGATAIELAIVAVPFLALVFTILNFALLLIQSVSLNVATAALATKIRTGQMQAPGVAVMKSKPPQIDMADVKTMICKLMPLFADCTSQLQLDIRPLSSFMQTVGTSPINGKQFNASNLCYYSGNAGQIVEVRAYYLYSVMAPFIAWLSPVTSYKTANDTVSGNFFPITATQVFKSESYLSGPNTGAGC